jgi:hypothetical protein
MRHAEAHLAFVGRRTHGAPHLVVERDHALCVCHQPLTIGLEGKPLVMALEQLRTEHLLQALDLLADGRLREVEQPGGARHAARLDDGDEGAQQGDIDVAAHGLTRVSD